MKAAKSKTPPPALKEQSTTGWVTGICLFLVVGVFLVFGQTARFGFVNYDDEENVYLNPVVAKGLSVKSVGWAFTHAQAANWIPLTTLSHMLDCQLFGLRAGGHHLVNVLWHAANAVLLFLLLRQMTGRLWRAAFVAAVFAFHPLRAESVAWISERKDVMSGFFFLLALGAYAGYARRPTVIKYTLMLLSFALALLAKSMVATLPFVLLLLDYWPLGRWREWRQCGALVREKIPLFVLSAASCAAAALVPGLIITDVHRLSFPQRLAEALVAYLDYLRQLIFPSGLATLYPIAPSGQPIWMVCLAFILLAAISAAVVAGWQRRPYLLTGWLWYLGMLFPVIGIIQISNAAARADRYTYLPEIGLVMAGTWALADWSACWKHRRLALGGLMGAVLAVLLLGGYRQTSYWRNGESLWTRTLACTSSNSIAHVYLGAALASEGKTGLALEHYRTAVAIAPDNVAALNNLGTALAGLQAAPGDQGQVAEAIACFRRAQQIDPASKAAYYNLGVALSREGRTEEAIAQYRKALEIDPNFSDAHLNLGNALRKSGQSDEAVDHLRQALKITPDQAAAYASLGLIYSQRGDDKQAAACWQEALDIEPDDADVQNNLAWLLATSSVASLHEGGRAVTLAEKSNQLKGGRSAPVMRTLAAAYAEAGRFEEAATTARRALALAEAQHNTVLAGVLPKEIKAYESNKKQGMASP